MFSLNVYEPPPAHATLRAAAKSTICVSARKKLAAMQVVSSLNATCFEQQETAMIDRQSTKSSQTHIDALITSQRESSVYL